MLDVTRLRSGIISVCVGECVCKGSKENWAHLANHSGGQLVD